MIKKNEKFKKRKFSIDVHNHCSHYALDSFS